MRKSRLTDEEIRSALLKWFDALERQTKLADETLGRPGPMKAHCGNRGLAVGCPVCEKKWAP